MPQSKSIDMLIYAAHRQTRLALAAKVASHGLTLHEFWTMLALNGLGALSLGTLARTIRMDAPTMSRLVQGLATKGYLTVGSDPTHGRRIRIELTATGSLLAIRDLIQIHNKFFAQTTNGLDVGECDTLRGLLDRYLQNLDSMLAKPSHNQLGKTA